MFVLSAMKDSWVLSLSSYCSVPRGCTVPVPQPSQYWVLEQDTYMSLWSTGSQGQWGPQLRLLESRGNHFNSQILESLSREGGKTVSCLLRGRKERFPDQASGPAFQGQTVGVRSSVDFLLPALCCQKSPAVLVCSSSKNPGVDEG